MNPYCTEKRIGLLYIMILILIYKWRVSDMNIAICDDDINDLTIISKMINKYIFPPQDNIVLFKYATELYKSFESGNFYDIVFLDIEMPTTSGYDIGKKLKQYFPSTLIIFVTNSMEYSIKGYGIAYRYITKPIDEKMLNDTLNLAIEEINQTKMVINIQNTSHVIEHRNIITIEVFNHSIVFTTKNQIYTFRGSIKSIYQSLPSNSFAMPNRSTIVNLNYITKTTCDTIVLTNGNKIPLSRRKEKEFINKLHLFFRSSPC